MAESRQGRILGLDAGDRRIGVAISDPDQHFALPLRSVVRDGHGGEFAALEAILRDEEIHEIVVGLPLSLSGDASAQTESASAFAEDLGKRFGVSIQLWDERLSTQEALRLTQPEPSRGGRRAKGHSPQPDTDALAASIILQAYLDRQRMVGSSG